MALQFLVFRFVSFPVRMATDIRKTFFTGKMVFYVLNQRLDCSFYGRFLGARLNLVVKIVDERK